jgi:hypothetical protein
MVLYGEITKSLSTGGVDIEPILQAFFTLSTCLPLQTVFAMQLDGKLTEE